MSLPNQILILEERLLHADHRLDVEALQAMIAPEFREIGPRGEMKSRDEVVAWLCEKDSNWQWQLHDFELQQLGQDLLLATYRAQRLGSDSLGATHSSIWQKHQLQHDAQWQIIFHQTTLCGV